MIWAVVVILLALLAYEVYSAANIKAQRFVKAQTMSGSDRVLLTFDDGPDPINTPKLLDLLDELGLKAYFFVVGEKAQQHPEIVRDIVRRGHTVGNHSMHHNPFHGFWGPHKYYRDEIMAADEVLRSIDIHTNLFRPPLGITNRQIAWACRHANMHVVAWDVRSFDTRNEPREIVIKRVLTQMRPGSIVLLHDRLDGVCDVVREVVTRSSLAFVGQEGVKK